MKYYFLCNEFFDQYKKTGEIKISLKNYVHNKYDILKDIYFEPKKIEQEKIYEVIESIEYQKVLIDTIKNLKNISLDTFFKNTVNELGNILDYRNIDKKVYIIIGMNTTTIYSTKYKNEDVTVILLESTLGIVENIKMLLAHEYTHWIREKEIKHDIFETCIGERFVTEGIACAFSEEVVPNKSESYYTIVSNTTIQWVKNNMENIDKIVENELDKNDMMYDFFYMFAKTKIPDMPVRTGYVYGYLKVKGYMRDNNLKIKDIMKKDWKKILMWLEYNHDYFKIVK